MPSWVKWIASVLALVVIGPWLIWWLFFSHTPDPTAGRRECPHTWRFKEGRAVVSSSRPTASAITNIPEFHDCQRFIVTDKRTGRAVYDSLYAIFASPVLDTLDEVLDSLDHQDGPGKWAFPAAEIYTEGGSYPALGIKTTFSCLFLFRDTDWRAILAPEPDSEPDCDTPKETKTVSGTQLEVRRQAYPGFNDRDYPPVARWDWDSGASIQYIGVKCGVGWCEVGKKGFTSSPTYDAPAGLANEIRRTRIIKGWYDEQMLATVSSGAVTPTPVRGTIIPDPRLGEWTSKTDFGTWKHVASVAVDGPPGTYKPKFNFDQASPTSDHLNELYFCYGSRLKCLGVAYFLWPISPVCGGGDRYYEKVVAVDGSKKFKCVTYFDASEIRIPGTARWRWLASDETTWKRCPEGCCETH